MVVLKYSYPWKAKLNTGNDKKKNEACIYPVPDSDGNWVQEYGLHLFTKSLAKIWIKTKNRMIQLSPIPIRSIHLNPSSPA